MSPLTLNLDKVHLTDEQFYDICQNNRGLKFELSPIGELIIMSPVGGESGNREADLIIDLGIWNRQTGLGYTFRVRERPPTGWESLDTTSSSTIFKLPNGGDRSPDAAWVLRKRWESLTPASSACSCPEGHAEDAQRSAIGMLQTPPEQRRKFPPIAPDFVIELRSATDSLEMLHVKMGEYMDAGVQLGWLINPQRPAVYFAAIGNLYKLPELEVINLPTELSGEEILPGFALSLSLY